MVDGSLTLVVNWLISVCKSVWIFMLQGGYLTLFPIVFLIIRKLVSIMKQFTN